MNSSRITSSHLKYHNWLFSILFISMIGLLGFLSTRYVYLADWTVNSENSLNEISLKLLDTFEAPIEVVSYTNNPRLKQAIEELIERYQGIKSDISLSFINPDLDPEKIRALNIRVDGEMIISYQGRQENLARLSEQDLTNTLFRLIRAKQRKILFVQGHGERSPKRQANFDLSDFNKHLVKQGFIVDTLNLIKSQSIPEDTSVLVIAGPRVSFLPGEVNIILDYIHTGGNLLWLSDPVNAQSNHNLHGLLALSELLGIEFLEGVVVDPSTKQYDIKRPDYAIIASYPDHDINRHFTTLTLFPQAAGIERFPGFLDNESVKNEADETNNPEQKEILSQGHKLQSKFSASSFLTTVEQSWVETSPIKESAQFSEFLDIAGPITIGMALNRSFIQQVEHESVSVNMSINNDKAQIISRQQRVVVLGDGDFLSNTYLGNVGNLSMGMNIFNWLSHDEQFISIPSRIKDDVILDISAEKLSLLASFFLLVMPGLLFLTGSIIWFKRRNR